VLEPGLIPSTEVSTQRLWTLPLPCGSPWSGEGWIMPAIEARPVEGAPKRHLLLETHVPSSVVSLDSCRGEHQATVG